MKSFMYNGIDSNRFCYNCKLFIEKIGEEIIETDKYIDIPIRVSKLNRDNEKVNFNENELYRIKTCLLEKQPKTLYMDGLVYKGQFIKKYEIEDIWYQGSNEGMIELTLRVYDKKNYSINLVHNYFIKENEFTFTINNKSNSENEFIYANVELKIFDDTTDITIENTSIENNKISLNELSKLNNIYIDSRKKYVIDKNDDLRNVEYTGEFIKLIKGINTIKVVSSGAIQLQMERVEEYKMTGGEM